MCFFTPFSLIILQLNNELSEELPELFQMVNTYNFITELVPGNKLGFRTTTRRKSDSHCKPIEKTRKSLAHAEGFSIDSRL